MSISNNLYSYRVVDEASDIDDSPDSNNFTLKFTSSEDESEIDEQELQLCISDDDFEDSATTSEINRSVSPVFNSNHLKRRQASTTSLGFKNNRLKTFSNKFEENSSSEESDVELHTFKKISKAHKEFFSSDDEDESLAINNANPGQIEPDSNFPQHKDERRVTRSQTLRKKRLVQKEVLDKFKLKRSLTIKTSIIPVCSGRSRTPLSDSKLLRKKLREMKLFRFLLDK